MHIPKNYYLCTGFPTGRKNATEMYEEKPAFNAGTMDKVKEKKQKKNSN